MDSIPGLGRSPGGKNGNPFQYSCLRNGQRSLEGYSPWGHRVGHDWACMHASVQSLSHVQLFVTPRTAVHQASLSITNSRSLLKLMSIESVMQSDHLILSWPLLPPSIFPSIRVFSNESTLRIRWPKYWSFSLNISPSNEYSGLISFRMDWLEVINSVYSGKCLHFS